MDEANSGVPTEFLILEVLLDIRETLGNIDTSTYRIKEQGDAS